MKRVLFLLIQLFKMEPLNLINYESIFFQNKFDFNKNKFLKTGFMHGLGSLINTPCNWI